jgi:hypothetical protein
MKVDADYCQFKCKDKQGAYAKAEFFPPEEKNFCSGGKLNFHTGEKTKKNGIVSYFLSERKHGNCT